MPLLQRVLLTSSVQGPPRNADGEGQELSQPQSGAPGTRAHSHTPWGRLGAQPWLLKATQASPCPGRAVDVHVQTPSLLLSPQMLLFVTPVGLGRSRVVQAEVTELLSSQPRSLLRWGEKTGLNGCCVQCRSDPSCPLEQCQSILRADTISEHSTTSLGSERTQTKQMSNAFFLLMGHCEIRIISLKCCVFPVRCCQKDTLHPPSRTCHCPW